jgi:hypothetical protein
VYVAQVYQNCSARVVVELLDLGALLGPKIVFGVMCTCSTNMNILLSTWSQVICMEL